MQTLDLQKVEISSGFSFSDPETSISIKGSCSIDNQSRKVKTLQGTVYENESDIIGTVAAHTTAEDQTFHTIAPYDMDDSVRISSIAKALFAALEQYDYTPSAPVEESPSSEEPSAGEGVEE